MKAVVLPRYGGPAALELSDVATHVPKADQVLVRVHAAGINPVDWKTRSGGGMAGVLGEPPFTLGWDVSGVVEKTGYNVQVQSVTVSALGTISTVVMAGTAKGNMHIVTLDKNGHAAAIRVIISGPGYYRDSLTSSTSGQLNVTDLPVGSYEVSCYTNPASVATVIISAGQTADVTVSQSKK